ncbi:MAG: four helix bundle protein [Deltaproteobacteria bacterium]|nr:MAG: four helix bundle protein [Deltaproteobacteria bacterium]HDN00811.1 four helix bundle protein [Deltaproteobacteria bacterium]
MSDLITKHGGYRKLKSFQVAQLIYDVTLRFCDKYIDKRSRTHDQMVQAARSGVQNIAEGSQASATSKKTEIKLTQVARASLEELKLDYEDFLRQRGLAQWKRENPLRQALIDRRCQTADDVAAWVVEVARENGLCGQIGQCGQNAATQPLSTESTASTLSTKTYPELSANAALTLLMVACSLLDRQVERLAQDFENEGGFTERLYRVRMANRTRQGQWVLAHKPKRPQ